MSQTKSMHQQSAMDRFFLAIPWGRMRVREDGCIRTNDYLQECPLEVIYGAHYIKKAYNQGGMTQDEVRSIMCAADRSLENLRGYHQEALALRQKMEQLILGHQGE